jgi:hypothetical protein
VLWAPNGGGEAGRALDLRLRHAPQAAVVAWRFLRGADPDVSGETPLGGERLGSAIGVIRGATSGSTGGGEGESADVDTGRRRRRAPAAPASALLDSGAMACRTRRPRRRARLEGTKGVEARLAG